MCIAESHALLKRDHVSPLSSSVVDGSSPNEFVGVNIKRLVPKTRSTLCSDDSMSSLKRLRRYRSASVQMLILCGRILQRHLVLLLAIP
jgi:hypothetical protein